MKQGTSKELVPKKAHSTVGSLAAGEWFIATDIDTDATPFMRLDDTSADDFYAVSWFGDLRFTNSTLRAFPITFTGVDDNGNVTYTMDEV